jgi:hypothetical protein
MGGAESTSTALCRRDWNSHCCHKLPNNAELPWAILPNDRAAAAVTLSCMLSKDQTR